MPTSSTETVDNAPLGHLISAVVSRLNPLAPSRPSQKPTAPQEFLPTRRLAGSLTPSAIGTTLTARRGGGRSTITSITRVVQDGEAYIQIDATGGGTRLCRPAEEIVTWAWETPRQPAPSRLTLVDLVEYRARSEAARQERLAEEAAHRPAQHQPQPLKGILAGLVG